MKQIKIILSVLLFCIINSCKNKLNDMKLERVMDSTNSLKPYILDYTFTSMEKKDSVMLSAPLHFRITNNSIYNYDYNVIKQGNYKFFKYFLINGIKYSTTEMLKNEQLLMPNTSDDIIYFFEIPVSKKSFENDLEVNKLLNDENLGDSIIIKNITSIIKDGIDEKMKKDMLIINMKAADNGKRIGIRYCFNINKAIVYDIDSLNKENPSYMFSCDKEFYKIKPK